MDGFKVREWRVAKGITQCGLAERSGLHRVLIARYEANEVEPRPRNAGKLAAGLGVSLFQLRQGPGIRPNGENR